MQLVNAVFTWRAAHTYHPFTNYRRHPPHSTPPRLSQRLLPAPLSHSHHQGKLSCLQAGLPQTAKNKKGIQQGAWRTAASKSGGETKAAVWGTLGLGEERRKRTMMEAGRRRGSKGCVMREMVPRRLAREPIGIYFSHSSVTRIAAITFHRIILAFLRCRSS